MLITVPCGIGARDQRCGDGPAALLAGGLLERLAVRGQRLREHATIFPSRRPGLSPHGVIADIGGRLARATGDAIDRGEFPIVLGGDHSCAIGSWSGVAAALASRGPLGLIWIDAHMDSHTSATSASGKVHGMPLAALLGHGTDPGQSARHLAFAHHGPLLPQHVCLAGVRSFEPEEAALLHRLGVRVIMADEVARRGFAAVLREAQHIATQGTAGYGLSIDLDALDPADAPGVGTPVPGGLHAAELLAACRSLASDPALVGIEVVEYNPHLDRARATAALVEEILAAVLGGA